MAAMTEDFDIGADHAEAALQLTDEREDPLLYSFALHNAARCKLFAGRGADHGAVERGMRLQRQGAAWEASVLPAYWALYFDDFATARVRFEELVRVFRDRGDEARCATLLAHLSVLEALGREHGSKPERCPVRRSTWQHRPSRRRGSVWRCGPRGQVAARGGDLETARAAAGDILERLELQPDITLENMARAVLGLAAVADGDYAEGDRQLIAMRRDPQLLSRPGTSRRQIPR